MAKKYFVEDLQNSVGLFAESEFAVVKSEHRTTREGKPYLDLIVRDRSGEVGAKVWSDMLAQVGEHSEGDVVRIDFEVREYRGKIELSVRKINKVHEFDADDFVTVDDSIDEDALIKTLYKRIDSIREFHLRRLTDAFFEDETFYKAYVSAPAGMYVHHDYRHGLLQHVLEILEILDSVVEIYPDLNRDLMTVGALLHDVGKLRELNVSMSGVTEYTKEGQLVGHIGIGILMIEKKIPEDFPDELRLQLMHIILSHQGKRETGSPVLPASREALAIYYADLTSTYLNIAENEKKRALKEKKEGVEFSNYNKYLGNSVYLG
jgi:3'-5' exoribonuclease